MGCLERAQNRLMRLRFGKGTVQIADEAPPKPRRGRRRAALTRSRRMPEYRDRVTDAAREMSVRAAAEAVAHRQIARAANPYASTPVVAPQKSRKRAPTGCSRILPLPVAAAARRRGRSDRARSEYERVREPVRGCDPNEDQPERPRCRDTGHHQESAPSRHPVTSGESHGHRRDRPSPAGPEAPSKETADIPPPSVVG